MAIGRGGKGGGVTQTSFLDLKCLWNAYKKNLLYVIGPCTSLVAIGNHSHPNKFCYCSTPIYGTVKRMLKMREGHNKLCAYV